MPFSLSNTLHVAQQRARRLVNRFFKKQPPPSPSPPLDEGSRILKAPSTPPVETDSSVDAETASSSLETSSRPFGVGRQWYPTCSAGDLSLPFASLSDGPTYSEPVLDTVARDTSILPTPVTVPVSSSFGARRPVPGSRPLAGTTAQSDVFQQNPRVGGHYYFHDIVASIWLYVVFVLCVRLVARGLVVCPVPASLLRRAASIKNLVLRRCGPVGGFLFGSDRTGSPVVKEITFEGERGPASGSVPSSGAYSSSGPSSGSSSNDNGAVIDSVSQAGTNDFVPSPSFVATGIDDVGLEHSQNKASATPVFSRSRSPPLSSKDGFSKRDSPLESSSNASFQPFPWDTERWPKLFGWDGKPRNVRRLRYLFRELTTKRRRRTITPRNDEDLGSVALEMEPGNSLSLVEEESAEEPSSGLDVSVTGAFPSPQLEDLSSPTVDMAAQEASPPSPTSTEAEEDGYSSDSHTDDSLSTPPSSVDGSCTPESSKQPSQTSTTLLADDPQPEVEEKPGDVLYTQTLDKQGRTGWLLRLANDSISHKTSTTRRSLEDYRLPDDQIEAAAGRETETVARSQEVLQSLPRVFFPHERGEAEQSSPEAVSEPLVERLPQPVAEEVERTIPVTKKTAGRQGARSVPSQAPKQHDLRGLTCLRHRGLSDENTEPMHLRVGGKRVSVPRLESRFGKGLAREKRIARQVRDVQRRLEDRAIRLGRCVAQAEHLEEYLATLNVDHGSLLRLPSGQVAGVRSILKRSSPGRKPQPRLRFADETAQARVLNLSSNDESTETGPRGVATEGQHPDFLGHRYNPRFSLQQNAILYGTRSSLPGARTPERPALENTAAGPSTHADHSGQPFDGSAPPSPDSPFSSSLPTPQPSCDPEPVPMEGISGHGRAQSAAVSGIPPATDIWYPTGSKRPLNSASLSPAKRRKIEHGASPPRGQNNSLAKAHKAPEARGNGVQTHASSSFESSPRDDRQPQSEEEPLPSMEADQSVQDTIDSLEFWSRRAMDPKDDDAAEGDSEDDSDDDSDDDADSHDGPSDDDDDSDGSDPGVGGSLGNYTANEDTVVDREPPADHSNSAVDDVDLEASQEALVRLSLQAIQENPELRTRHDVRDRRGRIPARVESSLPPATEAARPPAAVTDFDIEADSELMAANIEELMGGDSEEPPSSDPEPPSPEPERPCPEPEPPSTEPGRPSPEPEQAPIEPEHPPMEPTPTTDFEGFAMSGDEFGKMCQSVRDDCELERELQQWNIGDAKPEAKDPDYDEDADNRAKKARQQALVELRKEYARVRRLMQNSSPSSSGMK